jgi:Flp pilus assembly protein TadD
MNRKIIIFIVFLLFVSANYYQVAAQSTGTRIKKVDSAYAESVVWFSQPREISDIRLLLQNGEKERAIKKAREYVASLEHVGGVEAEQRLYYGLNALCAALTSKGKVDEAIDSCSRAIKLDSTRWQALNNRGTAYYISGKIDLALKDYRAALKQVQGSETLPDFIQHNIRLAEEKK